MLKSFLFICFKSNCSKRMNYHFNCVKYLCQALKILLQWFYLRSRNVTLFHFQIVFFQLSILIWPFFLNFQVRRQHRSPKLLFLKNSMLKKKVFQTLKMSWRDKWEEVGQRKIMNFHKFLFVCLSRTKRKQVKSFFWELDSKIN